MNRNTLIFPISEEKCTREGKEENGSGGGRFCLQSEGQYTQQLAGQLQLDISHPLHQETNKNYDIDFSSHSKIETVTPSESLVDFHNFQGTDNYAQNGMAFQEFHQQGQEHLHEQIALLREENMILREEMREIRANYEQVMRKQEQTRPIYSTEEVNRLLEENRSLEEIQKKLNSQKSALMRQMHKLQENLLQISASNHDYYKRVVAITNELEKERREFRSHLKEFEERLARSIQKQQKKSSALEEELANEREESENLRVIVDQSNEEIARIREEKQALEEECEALAREKEELNAYLQEKEDQEGSMLRQAIEERGAEIAQLRDQLQSFQAQNINLKQQCDRYHHLYQCELQKSQQRNQTIKSLQMQLQKLTSPNHNFPPSPSTSQCPSLRRAKVLCNESSRKAVLGQLKRAIKEISKIELENRITSLVQELYMDAEYRQRTNLQMQDIIVQLEKKIGMMEMGKDQKKTEGGHSYNQSYVLHLEASLDRYQKLLLSADSQKLRLIDQISALKKENYQIRLQLANSSVDNETQELIEQLTLQLEQEKYSNKILEQETEGYREQIRSIERELNEKNKRIKLLTLNLNKKGEGESKG